MEFPLIRPMDDVFGGILDGFAFKKIKKKKKVDDVPNLAADFIKKQAGKGRLVGLAVPGQQRASVDGDAGSAASKSGDAGGSASSTVWGTNSASELRDSVGAPALPQREEVDELPDVEGGVWADDDDGEKLESAFPNLALGATATVPKRSTPVKTSSKRAARRDEVPLPTHSGGNIDMFYDADRDRSGSFDSRDRDRNRSGSFGRGDRGYGDRSYSSNRHHDRGYRGRDRSSSRDQSPEAPIIRPTILTRVKAAAEPAAPPAVTPAAPESAAAEARETAEAAPATQTDEEYKAAMRAKAEKARQRRADEEEERKREEAARKRRLAERFGPPSQPAHTAASPVRIRRRRPNEQSEPHEREAAVVVAPQPKPTSWARGARGAPQSQSLPPSQSQPQPQPQPLKRRTKQLFDAKSGKLIDVTPRKGQSAGAQLVAGPQEEAAAAAAKARSAAEASSARLRRREELRAKRQKQRATPKTAGTRWTRDAHGQFWRDVGGIQSLDADGARDAAERAAREVRREAVLLAKHGLPPRAERRRAATTSRGAENAAAAAAAASNAPAAAAAIPWDWQAKRRVAPRGTPSGAPNAAVSTLAPSLAPSLVAPSLVRTPSFEDGSSPLGGFGATTWSPPAATSRSASSAAMVSGASSAFLGGSLAAGLAGGSNTLFSAQPLWASAAPVSSTGAHLSSSIGADLSKFLADPALAGAAPPAASASAVSAVSAAPRKFQLEGFESIEGFDSSSSANALRDAAMSGREFVPGRGVSSAQPSARGGGEPSAARTQMGVLDQAALALESGVDSSAPPAQRSSRRRGGSKASANANASVKEKETEKAASGSGRRRRSRNREGGGASGAGSSAAPPSASGKKRRGRGSRRGG